MSRKKTKEEKYVAIYQTHKNLVYRTCLYYLKDEIQAQELCLRVFCEFYRYFEAVPPEKIQGSLLVIAKEMVDNRWNE